METEIPVTSSQQEDTKVSLPQIFLDYFFFFKLMQKNVKVGDGK